MRRLREISLHRLTNLWYMYLHNVTLKKEHTCHMYTIENDNSLKSQTMNCHTILLYIHHPKDLTSTPKLKINIIKYASLQLQFIMQNYILATLSLVLMLHRALSINKPFNPSR